MLKETAIVEVFQGKPNPTKVVSARSTLKEAVDWFFGETGHVTTVLLEFRGTQAGQF